MKEIFIKNKTMIFRIGGSLMLIIAFVTYFWTTPKEGLTQNEIAAKNVARMEARAAGGSSTKRAPKSSSSAIMKAYKDTQATQLRYVLIIIMLLGIGSLGYSFIKKEET